MRLLPSQMPMCASDASEVTVQLNFAPEAPNQAVGMDTIDLFITTQTVYMIEEVELANAYTASGTRGSRYDGDGWHTAYC